MKNREEIREEAKREIIELLDRMGCYTYSNDGIEAWLDAWEAGCSKQIEDIAEKSQFYDGKCKIVFPEDYPREFDYQVIFSFADWLNHIIMEVEEASIDGYKYSEAKKAIKLIYSIKCALEECKICECNNEEISEFVSTMHDLDIDSIYDNLLHVIDEFEYARKYKIYCGKAFIREDIDTNAINYAQNLASVLLDRKALNQFVNERFFNYASSWFPEAKVKVGQKLSRAVNAIAKKYRISVFNNWDKMFAKFADAVNPLTVTKWTVISWHPIDYLTMSFGNSWSSCCTIDKKGVRKIKIGASRSSVTDYVSDDYVFHGEKCSATLSYMFDKSSFVYYTVNHKYDGNHYELEDKESRIIFALSEDYSTLLETRLYPQCNDDGDDSAYEIPRNIVQKEITSALDIPNLWKLKVGNVACCEYTSNNKGATHYNDFEDSRNKKCNISYTGDEPKKIYLGSFPICPNCGNKHTEYSSLNCEYC